MVVMAFGDRLNSFGGGVVTGEPNQCSTNPDGSLDYNHAIMVVGYEAPSANATTGAFIVKNSWGTSWANAGVRVSPPLLGD